MCYLVAKRFKKSGSVAFRTKAGKEMAQFVRSLQNKLDWDIQIVTISRPSAYGEYEPYTFVHSYQEFSAMAEKL